MTALGPAARLLTVRPRDLGLSAAYERPEALYSAAAMAELRRAIAESFSGPLYLAIEVGQGDRYAPRRGRLHIHVIGHEADGPKGLSRSGEACKLIHNAAGLFAYLGKPCEAWSLEAGLDASAAAVLNPSGRLPKTRGYLYGAKRYRWAAERAVTAPQCANTKLCPARSALPLKPSTDQDQIGSLIPASALPAMICDSSPAPILDQLSRPAPVRSEPDPIPGPKSAFLTLIVNAEPPKINDLIDPAGRDPVTGAECTSQTAYLSPTRSRIDPRSEALRLEPQSWPDQLKRSSLINAVPNAKNRRRQLASADLSGAKTGYRGARQTETQLKPIPDGVSGLTGLAYGYPKLAKLSRPAARGPPLRAAERASDGLTCSAIQTPAFSARALTPGRSAHSRGHSAPHFGGSQHETAPEPPPRRGHRRP